MKCSSVRHTSSVSASSSPVCLPPCTPLRVSFCWPFLNMDTSTYTATHVSQWSVDDKDPPTHQQGDTPIATVSDKSSLKRQISEQPVLKKLMDTYISGSFISDNYISGSYTRNSYSSDSFISDHYICGNYMINSYSSDSFISDSFHLHTCNTNC